MTPVLPSVAMAPFTDLLHSLADHSKGAEQMIGFADWRVFDLIPCLAPVRKILEVERILARLLLKSTAEVGGCPRIGLPLTAAANAAKLSCKPLISLVGAP